MENITSREFSHYPKKILKEGTYVVTSHKKPLWDIVVTKHNVTTSNVSTLPKEAKVPTNNVPTISKVPTNDKVATKEIPAWAQKINNTPRDLRGTYRNVASALKGDATVDKNDICLTSGCDFNAHYKGYCMKHNEELSPTTE